MSRPFTCPKCNRGFEAPEPTPAPERDRRSPFADIQDFVAYIRDPENHEPGCPLAGPARPRPSAIGWSAGWPEGVKATSPDKRCQYALARAGGAL